MKKSLSMSINKPWTVLRFRTEM